jgi:hypothetical protein
LRSLVHGLNYVAVRVRAAASIAAELRASSSSGPGEIAIAPYTLLPT